MYMHMCVCTQHGLGGTQKTVRMEWKWDHLFFFMHICIASLVTTSIMSTRLRVLQCMNEGNNSTHLLKLLWALNELIYEELLEMYLACHKHYINTTYYDDYNCDYCLLPWLAFFYSTIFSLFTAAQADKLHFPNGFLPFHLVWA